MPAEGGEPQLFYEEQPTAGRTPEVRPLDWTADGRYLAISSERTGKPALYLLPISDGKSAGEPVFVRYGDFEEGTTTATGALIYESVKPGGMWAVHLASLDANGRPGVWKRLDLPLGNCDSPSASWSADSNQIVYVTGNEDVGQTGQVVHVRNLSTGEDREIYHAPRWTGCVWAAQQPKLFCHVDRVGEKSDIISIAVGSGEIERLHTFPGDVVITNPSRDNRSLYMVKFGALTPQGEENGTLLRWEIATGQETALEQGSRTTGFAFGSPDER